CHVFGNDAAIGFAASQGNFQLNVFKPMIIYNFIQSIELLTDGMMSFNENCLSGLEINRHVIEKHVEESLMLVTALTPFIGYEKAAENTKLDYNENTSFKEAALKTGYVTEEQFEEWVDPSKMV